MVHGEDQARTPAKGDGDFGGVLPPTPTKSHRTCVWSLGFCMFVASFVLFAWGIFAKEEICKCSYATQRMKHGLMKAENQSNTVLQNSAAHLPYHGWGQLSCCRTAQLHVAVWQRSVELANTTRQAKQDLVKTGGPASPQADPTSGGSGGSTRAELQTRRLSDRLGLFSLLFSSSQASRHNRGQNPKTERTNPCEGQRLQIVSPLPLPSQTPPP